MVLDKIKDIFSGGEKGEKEEEIEEITLDKAQERIEEKKEELRVKDLEELRSISRKVENLKGKLSDFSKELENAKSTEDVHPNIRKSANEARRLFLKKLDKAIESIEIPEKPDWSDLLEINRSLKETVNRLNNARNSHGNQVGTLYESKMGKFRRLLKRLQDYLQDIDPKISEKKSRIEEINDLSEEISERGKLKKEKKELEEKLEELKEEKGEKEKKVKNKENSLESLKKSERFEEIEDMREELDKTSKNKDKYINKIQSKIKDLDRPLRKLNKMIERDEEMVSKEVMDGLSSYLNDPAKAALAEDDGLPNLRATLKELQEVLPDKMDLDGREREKHQEEVRELLEKNRISQLREKYNEAKRKIEKLNEEIENSPLLSKKERLEDEIERITSDLKSLEKDIENTKSELTEIENRIKSKSEKIENKFKKIFDLKIKDL